MNDETLDRIDRKLDALVKDVDEIARGVRWLKYEMYVLLGVSIGYVVGLEILLHR